METAQPRLPNFFLLGAGRSGTTSLYLMLREHPDIFFPDRKEPSFFCRPFQVVNDPISYVDLFSQAGATRIVGDASHVHFSHPEAARAIHAFFPKARFVLILRNPADRAYALYCWMVAHGYERHRSFEDALSAEDRRATSARVNDNKQVYGGNFLYFRSGLFGQQLQRYLEHFPITAFHVTTLDRLSTQPNETIAGICEFLGISPISVAESRRSNESRGVRSTTVQWLAHSVSRQLSQLGVPNATRGLGLVQRWNSRPKPSPLQASTRAELLGRYADDLKLVNKLTGIDLSS